MENLGHGPSLPDQRPGSSAIFGLSRLPGDPCGNERQSERVTLGQKLKAEARDMAQAWDDLKIRTGHLFPQVIE